MSLPAFVAAVAVSATLAHLLLRLVGRRYTEPAQVTRKLRRDLLVGSLLSLAGAAVGVAVADGSVRPAVERVVAGRDLLVTLLTYYGYTLAAVVVVLSGYLGLLPAIRRSREVDLGYRHAALRTGRWLAVLGLLVVLPPVAYLGGRRVVFRADDRAADRLGDETVAAALDRVTELHDVSPDAGLLARLASLRPSVGQRIDRLRSSAE